MTFPIAQSLLAVYQPTGFAQIIPPIASHQFHFKILGVLALVLGDQGSAQQTSDPFTILPSVIVAASHFKINGLPVATLTLSTAPPLAQCIVAGTNGHFRA